jgi:hypothetical protein
MDLADDTHDEVYSHDDFFLGPSNIGSSGQDMDLYIHSPNDSEDDSEDEVSQSPSHHPTFTDQLL